VSSGAGTTDLVIYSQGEDSSEDIYVRVYVSSTYLRMTVRDDAGGTHESSYVDAGSTFNINTDFPTQYYITADKDSICITFNDSGFYRPMYAGKFRLFASSLPNTTYKVGVWGYTGTSTVTVRLLRAQETTERWNETISTNMEETGETGNPNLYDGICYSIWPIILSEITPSNFAIGTLRYIYSVSSGDVSVLDTLAHGDSRVYTVFSDNSPDIWWCMRTQ